MTETRNSNPQLDEIVDQYSDFENIDGSEAADQLGISLGEFEKLVEGDPRFEFGVSPRFPLVNMESYRKWSPQQNDRGEDQ